MARLCFHCVQLSQPFENAAGLNQIKAVFGDLSMTSKVELTLAKKDASMVSTNQFRIKGVGTIATKWYYVKRQIETSTSPNQNKYIAKSKQVYRQIRHKEVKSREGPPHRFSKVCVKAITSFTTITSLPFMPHRIKSLDDCETRVTNTRVFHTHNFAFMHFFSSFFLH